MNITIDSSLFWSVIFALACYDVFTSVYHRILYRIGQQGKCSVGYYNQGVGPGGMVVKSRDALGPQEGPAAKEQA